MLRLDLYLSIDLFKSRLYHSVMEVFTALASPIRRQIVEMLARGELTAGEIAERFDVSQPAVSQHLKALREAGLVRVRIDGQRRVYDLDPEGLAEIDQWSRSVKTFWNARLDALERELRKPPSEETERN